MSYTIIHLIFNWSGAANFCFGWFWLSVWGEGSGWDFCGTIVYIWAMPTSPNGWSNWTCSGQVNRRRPTGWRPRKWELGLENPRLFSFSWRKPRFFFQNDRLTGRWPVVLVTSFLFLNIWMFDLDGCRMTKNLKNMNIPPLDDLKIMGTSCLSSFSMGFPMGFPMVFPILPGQISPGPPLRQRRVARGRGALLEVGAPGRCRRSLEGGLPRPELLV